MKYKFIIGEYVGFKDLLAKAIEDGWTPVMMSSCYNNSDIVITMLLMKLTT